MPNYKHTCKLKARIIKHAKVNTLPHKMNAKITFQTHDETQKHASHKISLTTQEVNIWTQTYQITNTQDESQR